MLTWVADPGLLRHAPDREIRDALSFLRMQGENVSLLLAEMDRRGLSD